MNAPEKVDLFKQNKAEYASPKKPVLVDVKKGTYLSIEGRGAPGDEEFGAKVGALYGVVYTIKMTRKSAGEPEFVVCKLEGQYWVDGSDGSNYASVPKEQWNWKLMIRVPTFVKAKELKSAVAALLEKGKEPEVAEVRLETFAQGSCVQMLHLGPYEKEPETIAKMQEYSEAEGYARHGRHHEIYISDPRRVPPEKLKTILRMPVRK